MPYVVFDISDNVYAIPSQNVVSMYSLGTVTPMVDMPSYVRGMTEFREAVITLYDIRILFGKLSYKDELEAFVKDCINDHAVWVDELERCARTGNKFTLATDPAQCGFIKRMDSFKTNNNSIRGQLTKVAAPHRRLHQAAEDVVGLISMGQTQEALAAVAEIKATHYNDTIGLLNKIMDIYNESNREMVIALNMGKKPFGIIVDHIIGVERLREILPIPNVDAAEYVSHVGISDKDGSTVLMLDCSTL